MKFIPILIVSATKKTKEEFDKSPLGLSMDRLIKSDSVTVRIVTENTQSLSVVYNKFINEDIRDSFIVFIHDDVWSDDVFIAEHLQMALSRFDIVGVAGNTRLVPNGRTWFYDENNIRDDAHLSGGIGFGAVPFGHVNFFGPTPAEVQLLDGVFIAARGSALLDKGVRFDERFDFHFYDLDFSRTATKAGLKLGTWPISLTHVSDGGNGFDSPSWEANLILYQMKWGEGVNAP